jgi:hypothetical protein
MITPPDFVISSIEVTMELGGELFGVSLGGNVTVTLAPGSR